MTLSKLGNADGMNLVKTVAAKTPPEVQQVFRAAETVVNGQHIAGDIQKVTQEGLNRVKHLPSYLRDVANA